MQELHLLNFFTNGSGNSIYSSQEKEDKILRIKDVCHITLYFCRFQLRYHCFSSIIFRLLGLPTRIELVVRSLNDI